VGRIVAGVMETGPGLAQIRDDVARAKPHAQHQIGHDDSTTQHSTTVPLLCHEMSIGSHARRGNKNPGTCRDTLGHSLVKLSALLSFCYLLSMLSCVHVRFI
jgi:hypothetical protein